MATLHIEHAITDLPTWRAAFDRFDARRAAAGVTGSRIHQPVDDAHYVFVQLDFPTAAQAVAFKAFLESEVWAVAEHSPALTGPPRAVVLDGVEQNGGRG